MQATPMIRQLLAACAIVACSHQTPMVDVEYHVVDGGGPTADGGSDFLSTGTMAAGLAVAIDVKSSSSAAVIVTSTNTAVLEVLPTSTYASLIVAHIPGNATLEFTVAGELAREIPVTVVPP
jgi:hypothetical protein